MRNILLGLLVLPLIGCYSVNSSESVEVPDDLSVDERIETAKAVVDSLWSGGLREEVQEQFPKLTKFELLGLRLSWKATWFQPQTGNDQTARATVTITCTMRQKSRFGLGRPIATYCRDRVEEALDARTDIELESALYVPAVDYIESLFPATEVLIHPRTLVKSASSFGPLPPSAILPDFVGLEEFAGEDLAEGFGSTFQSAPIPSAAGHLLSSADAAMLEAQPTAMLDQLRRRYGSITIVQFSTPKVDAADSALLYYEFRDPTEGWAGNGLKLSRDESGWKVDGQFSVAFS